MVRERNAAATLYKRIRRIVTVAFLRRVQIFLLTYLLTTHTTASINHTGPLSIHQMAPPMRGSKHPITAYYSVYRPRKDERLIRPGRLVTYRNKVPPPGVEPGHITHPSSNRARRRVTSLIRPMALPLRHAATNTIQYRFQSVILNGRYSDDPIPNPKPQPKPYSLLTLTLWDHRNSGPLE